MRSDILPQKKVVIKRILILALFSVALFLPQGRAQFQGIFNNTYLVGEVGPNYYLNRNARTIGGGVELGFGKWINNTASLRGIVTAQYANKAKSSEIILYGHADVLFDLVSSIRGRNTSRFRSYLLIGIGLAHNMSGDNDFCGVLGIGGDWQIVDDWRLVCELSTLVHPSDFDNNSYSSFLPSLSIGVLRDINYNPRRSRAKDETRQFGYDWFFQVAFGVNSMNYKGIGTFEDRIGLLVPAFEFGIGKSLTKAWSCRLTACGLYAKTQEELFTYYNLRGDLMLDVTGWLMGERGRTMIDMKPYLGASLVSRLDNQAKFLLGSTFGAMLVYRHDEKNELFLDARYLLTPPRFAHVTQKQETFSVGMATMTVGYSYVFTRNSF